ncbi:MAG: hypothetical protein ACREOK_10940 [Gemmatimonadaceae bacterium]
MDDLEVHWLRTLQTVVDKAAHEIKDSLNGVSLNLEVVKSRSRREGMAAGDLAEFATAAGSQLETLIERTEALVFLTRPHKRGSEVDVALTLRHLATLLVPAAHADGIRMSVSGWERQMPTAASAEAVRLGIGAGLLLLAEKGGSCRPEGTSVTVVRFSHESAETCSLDAAIAASLAEQNILIQRADRDSDASDLLMVFPGT